MKMAETVLQPMNRLQLLKSEGDGGAADDRCGDGGAGNATATATEI